MPVRSKKPCNKPGCINLAEYPHRYCRIHQHIEQQEEELRQEYLRDRYKKYSATREDIKEQKFYISSEWLAIREYIMAKYKGICVYSFFIDHEVKPADTVHHIIEIKEDWNRRLDITNLIPVSYAVHQKIHYLYRNNKKKETQDLLNKILEAFKNTFKKEKPPPDSMGEGV